MKEQGLEDMGHPVMDIVEVNKEKGLIFTALGLHPSRGQGEGL